jgi:hypothetical protein
MSTVEEIVEAIKELPAEKRDEVRRQLVSLWPMHSPESARERPRSRRPPIQIKGKPISETIIEDRR